MRLIPDLLTMLTQEHIPLILIGVSFTYWYGWDYCSTEHKRNSSISADIYSPSISCLLIFYLCSRLNVLLKVL